MVTVLTRACCALVAFVGLTQWAAAQAYPNKPVLVIMPLQAASASDIAARIVVERMSEGLKQQFIVENVAAAAGLVGTERVRTSRPDGYTLAALNNSILTILPNVNREKARFDSSNDFIPIRGIATIPTSIGVNASVPVKTVPEFLAYAKARPGQLNYASGGPGSPQHLATEMFMHMAQVRMTHVPYRGATQAAADLAAGQVHFMMISHTLALPFLDDGKVKLIGFAGSERSAQFPQLPTAHENGVPGFDYSSWIALFAPKGTPDDVVARLRAEATRVMAMPDLPERLTKSGLEIWNQPHDRLATIIKEDHARWDRVVREANIKVD
jgi:tripartite-type tricarboxylate transporter receptor subunit TctC